MPNNDWRERFDEQFPHALYMDEPITDIDGDMYPNAAFPLGTKVKAFITREIEAARKEEREKARKLVEALEALLYAQNGATLITLKKGWVEAMRLSKSALKEYQEGK